MKTSSRPSPSTLDYIYHRKRSFPRYIYCRVSQIDAKAVTSVSFSRVLTTCSAPFMRLVVKTLDTEARLCTYDVSMVIPMYQRRFISRRSCHINVIHFSKGKKKESSIKPSDKKLWSYLDLIKPWSKPKAGAEEDLYVMPWGQVHC